MYPVCLRYCKDEQSASSAMHAGFLNIFNGISSLKDVNKLEAWMRRIIVNASIDQLKDDKKFSFEEVGESHLPDMSSTDDNAHSERYLPLLKLLPEGYRLVFNMRILEELPHQEIAKILGITESTSRTQLFKAKKMLKKIIDAKSVII